MPELSDTKAVIANIVTQEAQRSCQNPRRRLSDINIDRLIEAAPLIGDESPDRHETSPLLINITSDNVTINVQAIIPDPSSKILAQTKTKVDQVIKNISIYKPLLI